MKRRVTSTLELGPSCSKNLTTEPFFLFSYCADGALLAAILLEQGPSVAAASEGTTENRISLGSPMLSLLPERLEINRSCADTPAGYRGSVENMLQKAERTFCPSLMAGSVVFEGSRTSKTGPIQLMMHAGNYNQRNTVKALLVPVVGLIAVTATADTVEAKGRTFYG